jgi:hypothetical protein
MLDTSATRLLGLPVDERLPRGGVDHPAVEDAARAGWSVGKIGDWSTFKHAAGQALHVGLLPQIDLRQDKLGTYVDFPLYGPWLPDTISSLALWQEVTGSAWHGNPGIAGTAILRALAPKPQSQGGRSQPPTWRPAPKSPSGALLPVGPDDVAELDLMMGHWHRGVEHRFIHGYDWNRQYIAAAIALEVCPWPLKHTGRIAFDKRRAGWWLVELAPWNVPTMPDPAGYLDEERRVLRWVTTPTLTLLEELTAEGVYGGARIVDSWTGPARDGITRPWGERMRDAYALVHASGADPGDVERVRTGLKLAGRQTPGLWATNAATNWIHRPDWWYALVALARCNQWRAMWREGKATGRWPVTIDRDNMWYSSDLEDPDEARPQTIKYDPTGMRLGHVKPKAIRVQRGGVAGVMA